MSVPCNDLEILTKFHHQLFKLRQRMPFSDDELTVLRLVLLGKQEKRPYHATAISGETGIPYTTVRRLLSKLTERGLITQERLGNSQWVRTTPQAERSLAKFVSEQKRLLAKAYANLQDDAAPQHSRQSGVRK